MRTQVGQALGQQQPGPVQAPLHRLLRNANHAGHLGVRQPLDTDQVEDLTLLLWQALDRPQHATAVRAETGGAAAGRGHDPGFGQLCGGRLFI